MRREPVEGGGNGPGRIWEALLAWLMPSEQRGTAIGDAREEWRLRARRDPREAGRWYRRQVARSVPWAFRHWVRSCRRLIPFFHREPEGLGMWMKDMQLAFRMLRKRPLFTATVVLTLGLGVGATTALYGVFRSVFMEPLPLPDSERLMFVMQSAGFGCCGPASGPDYLDWVDRQRSFEAMGGIDPGYANLTSIEPSERVYGTRVTASAFDLLDVPPLMGRPLRATDRDSDVVVLAHGLWQTALGGRPDAVGATIELDGVTRTIVGVMPEGFDVPSPWARTVRHQYYVPFRQEALTQRRGSHYMPVLAKLSEGTSVETAQADMDRIMVDLAVEYPTTNADRSARVFTVHEYLFGDVGRQLGLILAAAAVVLLIACGNVAGLQLARAAGRETELAVRAAMGASRKAMVRLLFSESALLALAGGAVGTIVALFGVDALKAVMPDTIPRLDQVRLDAGALLFALGAALLTAVAFGMLPALLASKTDLASGVREGGYATLAPRKERARDYFIVAQIALGLVLANGAALLVRSYTELLGQDYGFRSDGVLTLALSPAGERYESGEARKAFIEEVTNRIGGIPGIASVGFVSRLPLDGGTNGNVLVEGRGPRANGNDGPLVEVTNVAGDYLATMGIPLLSGRMLVPEDTVSTAIGVLVNRAMVDEVWSDEDPLGKRFSFSDDPPEWLTVVGVVGNVRQWGPERPPIAQVYFPYPAGWSSAGYVVARAETALSALTGQVRGVIQSIDATQPPSDIRGMADRMEATFAQRRFYTTLIGAFALAALFLASAGIYGTVSYFVARRNREMGIRMALGAERTGIMRLVFGRGLRLVVQGVVLGLVGVWATTSVLERLVYGVGAIDPGSLVLGCLVLGAAALSASTLPALRAVRIPPVMALRSE